MAEKNKGKIQPIYENGKYIVVSEKPLHSVNFAKGERPYELTGKQIRVTLVKSTIACLDDQQATVAALGLHKIRQSKVFNDNDAIRGMIFKVKHLVEVEEV